jgi:hypothetical protein
MFCVNLVHSLYFFTRLRRRPQMIDYVYTFDHKYLIFRLDLTPDFGP